MPMAIYDVTPAALDGRPLDIDQVKGRATLIVNVASRCGLTPQYETLEKLQEQYQDRGSQCLVSRATSSASKSRDLRTRSLTFCSTTYGVTFPLTEKIDVNGRAPPAVPAADGDPDPEGRGGRRAVEFREVPRSPGRPAGGPFPPAGTPGLERGRLGHRVGAPGLTGPTPELADDLRARSRPALRNGPGDKVGQLEPQPRLR